MKVAKQIFFVPTCGWSIEHPVYKLIVDHPPAGFEFCNQERDADIVMAPTSPLYFGDKPWLVFIEDWVTLYHPDLQNGRTVGVNVLEHPRTAQLREMFQRGNFKGIVCHHRGTFDDLAILNLTDKLFYVPIGMPEQPRFSHENSHSGARFLFINSWSMGSRNFLNRGGEIVAEAFLKGLDTSIPWSTPSLTILCGVAQIEALPSLRQCPWVTIKEEHISEADLHAEIRRSDCVLLPAHRVHAHSILLPFSYGVPVIGSDGWGMDEYIIDGVTGLRVRGIYGKTSYKDGLFREDYSRQPETLTAVDELARLISTGTREKFSDMGSKALEYVRRVHGQSAAREELGYVFRSALG